MLKDNSTYIYRFLGTLWDGLPTKDRIRFAEMWKGYEQVFAEAYQKLLELGLSNNINTIPTFSIQRWNKYSFKDLLSVPATFVSRAPIFTPLDLTTKYIVRVGVDGVWYDIDCRGEVPKETRLDEIIVAINKATGFEFAAPAYSNTLMELTTATSGASSSIEVERYEDATLDGTTTILGVIERDLPLKVPEYPYKYSIEQHIHKIPTLQDGIRNENITQYYIEGLDFRVSPNDQRIEFIERPVEHLWARSTYLDVHRVYQNYGSTMDIWEPNAPPEQYAKTVKALWFAFWHGPRPAFMERALYLIFNLPSSSDIGIVNRVLPASGISPSIMEIIHIDGTVTAYLLPEDLEWREGIVVGSYVEQFQPLCTGIDVYDKVSLPNFVDTEIGYGFLLDPFALPTATRGPGDTDETKAIQMLQEHTYLPQIDVNAFISPGINLANVMSFLRTIQPLHKTFQFQISLITADAKQTVEDFSYFDIEIDITPNLEINQTNSAPVLLRDAYDLLGVAAPYLDLDSESMAVVESGIIDASDNTGPLPMYGVVWT